MWGNRTLTILVSQKQTTYLQIQALGRKMAMRQVQEITQIVASENTGHATEISRYKYNFCHGTG